MCAQSLNCVQLFVTPQTVAHQAPLSMKFSRQEYWSGLPFPFPGDLPDPGIKPASLVSPSLTNRFFYHCTTYNWMITSQKLKFHYFDLAKLLASSETSWGGAVVKILPANAGDTGSIPELGRSPGEGNGNPFQYSCLENFMERGAWRLQSTRLQRVRHSWAHTHTVKL